MADTQLIIPKTPVLDKSEDYAFLRKEGLKFIEKLSSKFWTDYNDHDPGITIEELFCYAITDLGYRTSFSIPDLLTSDPDNPSEEYLNFFTAREILPVNPVSETDLRKLILDIPGIKNAWFRVAQDSEQTVYIDRDNCGLTLERSEAKAVLPINGLYTVLVQYEDDDAKKEEYDAILREVRKRLMETRNLCEDYLSITQVQYEDIAICSDIEVRPDADITVVAAKIYRILIDYFSPPVNFRTLEEMLDMGKSIDEIFEGPALSSGFIDSDELDKNDLRTVLHTSDLYNLILDIKEVVAIRTLKLIRYVNGEPDGTEAEWELQLGAFRSARLEMEKSKIIFYKGVFPYMPNAESVEDQLKQLQQTSGSFRKKGHKDNVEVPKGKFRNVSDYYPLQNEFPMVYGIGTAGLQKDATVERKAQALQLKEYLLFFEQLLSDYLGQLVNVKKLFAYNHTVDRTKTDELRMKIVQLTEQAISELDREDFGIIGRTYYTQQLSEIDGLPDLLINHSTYGKDLDTITETMEVFSERRNRFLDHLLARFCEDLNEYCLTQFRMDNTLPRAGLLSGLRVVHDKESLLLDYPKSSSNRGRGFNYKPEKNSNPNDPFDTGVWDSVNIAGMKNRISRLLGMAGDQLDSLALKCLQIDKAALYTVFLYNKQSGSNRMSREVLLQTTGIFTHHIDADHYAEAMLIAAWDEDNFEKLQSGGKYYFRLNDPLHSVVMAESPKYNTEADRNKAYDATMKLFDQHIAFKYMSIKENASYTVTLFDRDLSTVLMQCPKTFAKKHEALTYVQKFLAAARDSSAFRKMELADKHIFRLVDRCHSDEILGESLKFDNASLRDAAHTSTLALFADSRQHDVIRRRTLATDLLDIHTEGDGKDQRWWVELSDPDHSTQYLLKSRIDDTRECAESILLYMLHNGDNPTIYKTVKTGDKYGFVMFDDCGNEIAASNPVNAVKSEELANQQSLCVVRFFREHCDVENFHVVEHILLRPRTNIDALLPACINCSASAADSMQNGTPAYTIDVYRLAEKEIQGTDQYAKRMRDILKSQVSTAQVKAGQIPGTDIWGFMVKDALGHPILYSEGYIGLNSCTNGIASMRENGTNTSVDVPGVKRYEHTGNICLGNYRIFERTGNFHFHLYADNAQVVTKSAVAYDSEEEALAAVYDLVKWLGYENPVLPADFVPGHDEDPYSFRISVLLPAWPSRFRDQSFRHYVEKVIRQETPAHIYPRICWINLQHMRDFEYQYRRWLQSISGNDIPNPHTTADFIDVLFSVQNVYPTAILHSCDDVKSNEPQVILDNTMLGTL
jgi:uncharacterized protein YegP (UPF0339 family)